MLKRYFPDMYIDDYNSIDLNVLKDKGIKGLIFDIDNTLVATDTREPGDELISWLEEVKSIGFKLCIVSNASKKRVEIFNKKISLVSISRAKKPLKCGFLKASELMDIKVSEIAVVGDQIFCDILGGNKLNMMTILVKPIHKKEFWFVRLKRIPERFILFKYNSL